MPDCCFNGRKSFSDSIVEDQVLGGVERARFALERTFLKAILEEIQAIYTEKANLGTSAGTAFRIHWHELIQLGSFV